MIFTGVFTRKNFSRQYLNKKFYQEIWYWLVVRIFLLFFLIFSLSYSFYSRDQPDLNIFLLILGLTAFTSIVIELLIKNNDIQQPFIYYGTTFAIYELLIFFLTFSWIWVSSSHMFKPFEKNIWNEAITDRLFQVFILIAILYCISRSADYLGFKQPSTYEYVFPPTLELPVAFTSLYQGSQQLFQVIIVVFLSLSTLESMTNYLFRSVPDYVLIAIIFCLLLLIYFFIVILISILTYRTSFDLSLSKILLIVGLIIVLFTIFFKDRIIVIIPFIL
jgi:hypothetical protein